MGDNPNTGHEPDYSPNTGFGPEQSDAVEKKIFGMLDDEDILEALMNKKKKTLDQIKALKSQVEKIEKLIKERSDVPVMEAKMTFRDWRGGKISKNKKKRCKQKKNVLAGKGKRTSRYPDGLKNQVSPPKKYELKKHVAIILAKESLPENEVRKSVEKVMRKKSGSAKGIGLMLHNLKKDPGFVIDKGLWSLKR